MHGDSIHGKRRQTCPKAGSGREGGYVVTSPLDPELITEAETIEEAFANARDASQALKQSRVKLLRRLSVSKSSR